MHNYELGMSYKCMWKEYCWLGQVIEPNANLSIDTMVLVARVKH